MSPGWWGRSTYAADGVHRLEHTLLVGVGQLAQHRADVRVRPRLERGEGGPPPLGQRQMALAPVGFRRRSLDQVAPLEAAQDAAQVARVQAELAAELRRGGLLAVRKLVEHPHLAQRERALEIALVQQADLLGVEAVEAPHRRDARIEAGLGHRRSRPPVGG